MPEDSMRFLKTLLWIIFAIILTVFSFNNWNLVTIDLWAGLQFDTKLPVLVIGAFLIGFVPLWLFYRATRWRFNRRIASLDAQLNTNTISAPPPALDLTNEQIMSTDEAPSQSI